MLLASMILCACPPARGWMRTNEEDAGAVESQSRRCSVRVQTSVSLILREEGAVCNGVENQGMDGQDFGSVESGG